MPAGRVEEWVGIPEVSRLADPHLGLGVLESCDGDGGGLVAVE